VKKLMIASMSSNSRNKVNKTKCPDCDSKLSIPFNIEQGEVLSCPSCGLELEVKKISNGGECIDLQELVIEGEDWGE
jgi:alpha-aminoadipate/glutamate carrier protein LysW